MENQEKKKNVKPIVIAVIVTLLFSAAAAYLGGQTLVQSAYDNGHEIGYDEGYDTGHSEGYDEGYSDAEYDNGGDDYSGYLGPYPGTSTPDADSESAVWVTPSGEKYHRSGCQYINGKYNLEEYSSPSAAEANGYEPCSRCN